MSTVMWESALQGVAPRTGGSALPPATYRLRAVAGEGKLNSNSGIMLSLTFEVASGPLQGRKAFHNENLPKGNTDGDKDRMAYFLGLMESYGLSGAQLAQMFAGQAISVETIDCLAKQLVASQRIIKGTCRKQRDDDTRVNWGGWTVDDGQEPEPPKQTSAPVSPVGPPAPGMGTSGLPLGGFPGSAQPGQMQPNPGPAWAQGPAAQQPVPQGFAPAAQAPQQAFQMQPQQAPQNDPWATPGEQTYPPQQAPGLQEGFQGQQFPGQVNPNAFPAQNQQPPAAQMPGMQQFGATQQDQMAAPFQQQQPQGFAPGVQPGQQMPGMPAPQQPGNPAGLPQGGFPQQGGAPTASF